MKKIKFLEGKKPAQAMVEFAIALPILLLLLYGILETGRFIFIYSSIVTASRQAVRYGSATGEGTTTGIPRYQDCAGIRQAAQRADYLNAVDDADIHIYQDKGPTDPPTATGVDEQEICPDNNPYIWTPSAGNTSRLVVRINGDFNPIIPKIVPFIARTSANGNPVEGVSARTILVSVSIVVTVPPSTWIRAHIHSHQYAHAYQYAHRDTDQHAHEYTYRDTYTDLYANPYNYAQSYGDAHSYAISYNNTYSQPDTHDCSILCQCFRDPVHNRQRLHHGVIHHQPL